MYRLAKGTFVLCALAICASPAAAQFALTMDFHQTGATFNCSGVDPATVTCEDLDVDGPYAGASEQVMILIGGANPGIVAVQFGLGYDSTGETSIWSVYNNCSAQYQQISLLGPNGEWPTSGSGIAIAFGQCITPANDDGLMPIGFLFSAAPVTTGSMSIIPDPAEGDIKVVDCDDLTRDIDPANVGSFGFGEPGVKQCGTVVPTQPKSWGQIKALF